MTSNAALDTHLPSVLADARALASGDPIDTSALLTGPMLFDLCDYDRLVIQGRDRVRFLHAMLSNDVAALESGQGRWATFNTVQGKTVTDVRLFVVDADKRTGSILAILEPGAGRLFSDGLDRFVISEKVYFEPAEQTELHLLCGHGAGEALRAAGAEPPGPGRFDHARSSLGGADVRVLRLDRLGPDVEALGLWFDSADAAAVLGALEGVPRGGRRLLEAARVEAGQPRFGIDLTEDNIPLEAGLKDLAISFTKGCYIGQEVICRIDSRGSPKTRLVQLDLGDGGAPEPGTELFVGPKKVGHTTSGLVSARLGTTIVLGYVRKKHNAVGGVVLVGAPDASRTAMVIAPVGVI